MPAEPNRRATLIDEISERSGVTEAMIAELVDTFYGRVRQDPLLAPVFARVENWDEHLTKLRAFWSSVVLMSGRYHGQPMQAHFPLAIESQHFDRWLSLFEQTTSDVCPPAAAAVFMEKARRIADSFAWQWPPGAARLLGPGISGQPNPNHSPIGVVKPAQIELMRARAVALLPPHINAKARRPARKPACCKPIHTAPSDIEIELAVIDREGSHALVFPCCRALRGWIKAETGERIAVHPTHSRPWRRTPERLARQG
jgi:hemoglobin